MLCILFSKIMKCPYFPVQFSAIHCYCWIREKNPTLTRMNKRSTNTSERTTATTINSIQAKPPEFTIFSIRILKSCESPGIWKDAAVVHNLLAVSCFPINSRIATCKTIDASLRNFENRGIHYAVLEIPIITHHILQNKSPAFFIHHQSGFQFYIMFLHLLCIPSVLSFSVLLNSSNMTKKNLGSKRSKKLSRKQPRHSWLKASSHNDSTRAINPCQNRVEIERWTASNQQQPRSMVYTNTRGISRYLSRELHPIQTAVPDSKRTRHFKWRLIRRFMQLRPCSMV